MDPPVDAGRVVCHHASGIGVYISGCDQYGYVDVPQISDKRISGSEDYAQVQARVLGYSGSQRQLYSSLRPQWSAAALRQTR